jgi:hypothetical protein
MRDIPLIVFHVEQEHSMGIGPQEFRHRGLLHDNYIVRFVRRASVMRQQGATNRWKNTKQGQKHEELIFQPECPESESFARLVR